MSDDPSPSDPPAPPTDETGPALLTDVLGRSRELGLLGPGAVEQHVIHATHFVELTRERAPSGRALDLGSGGGVPGLVVAVGVPTLRLTLLDASQRRGAFLRDAVRRLGIDDRVDVVVGRAEDLARDVGHREHYDVVMARSFGPPAVTAECAVGFARPGGVLLISEPEGGGDRWPADGLAALGLVRGDRHESIGSSVQELRRTGDSISRFPRRSGTPTRRPLF